MKKYRDLMLRFLPFLLIVILTVGLTELFFRKMIVSTTEECWDELSMAHGEAAREISTRLKANAAMLDLAADAIVMNADFRDSETVLAYLAGVQEETLFDRIDVVLPNGTILVQATGEYVPDHGEKTYEELLAKGSHLSQRVPDFLTGKETIHTFSPVYDANGEPIAILGASVYCDTLAETFVSAHYGEDAQLFLVDRRDGNFVLDKRYPTLGNIRNIGDLKKLEEYRNVDVVGEILSGKSGHAAFEAQAGGRINYMTYGPVEGTELSLAMTLQDDVVFLAVNETRESLTRVAVGECVLLLLFAAWTYIEINKSMQNANRAQQAELALLHQKEKALESRYEAAADRQEFLETLAANLPGGYHRCTTDHSFRITFTSNSFTQATGYTLEQLNEEHGGSYMAIVAPEDRDYFLSLAPQLERDGHISCAYRIRRRDGSIRWVQDSTQYVERDGEQYYQCALSDINDIILRQEKYARQADLLDTLEANMPGGYHRCANAEGWPFLLISDSFTEVVGWSAEEIRTLFDNRFINMVLQEDWPLCAGIVEEVQEKGYSNAVYRIKQKDGGYIWVSDATMRVDLEDDCFYHGVLADVTAQIEELEKARKDAEASSQAKSTFLFNISHDIRTPMNAIKGFSRIIEENAENPALVRETIGKINQAGNSLMMLMNDVLDISRIERGKEALNLEPLDLYEHGRNLYEMFMADMRTAGIEFTAAGDRLDDYVYCDELKLTRILMNMLSNARKFTPVGGKVIFGGTRVHRDEKTCTYRFFVRDTGIGMSPEFQKRAFEQFERERTSTESGVPGSGLGLAIIKMLVELMGGTVEIRSELGRGTEIAATLTFHLADREHKRQAGCAEQAAPDMTGKRVLLVEDNDFNREIARYILEGAQIAVEEAENGAVCIERLRAADPGYYDLILMDVQMPVMDGYTATLEIRNLPDRARADIPIVAMTANAFAEDRQKCLDVGMNGHIGKPFDTDILMQVLSEVL